MSSTSNANNPPPASQADAPNVASVIVRPIAVHDVTGFHACLDVVARERLYIAQVEALPIERMESFVRESVANDAIQFVAVDGERVVGWADIFGPWQPTLAHVGALGMGVHPAYRGRGLGRRLLQACLDKSRTKGLTRIDLEVRADNSAAIRLYERLGFVVEARRRRGLRVDGIDHDTLAMAFLPPA